ncbi:MAG: DNA mismatch endonuclease Vsr [Zoogloeaceae bacterium]|nr:DNA mismatch endonuclease Vsr [Zoogloeaceae bacterium]
MADVISAEERSRLMSRIRSKDTGPELLVRRLLHGRGFRYRLHVREMPGKPDLVFPKYHAAIFVSGCFWHGHDCPLFRLPGTRQDFWRDKIERNRANDLRTVERLSSSGWRILTVWECALRGKSEEDVGRVADCIVAWLQTGTAGNEITGKNARA